MTYWLASGLICSVVGYWLAARYGLDRRLGLGLGFCLSSFFSVSLWRFAPAYDTPTQALFILFALLAFLTVLALVEKKTLIGVMKLVALTFSFSVLFHNVIPDHKELSRTQSLLAHYVPAAPYIALDSPFFMTKVHAASFLESFPEGAEAVAHITAQTQLFEERNGTLVPSSENADGEIWALVDSELVEIDDNRYVRVRIRNREGSSSDIVRYVPESAAGLRVLIPVN
jgi:hypothetical protein